MSQMDLAAGNLAAGTAKGRCATIAVEAINFVHPVYVGDEVSIYAEMKRVGRTSMNIFVEAWRRSRDSSDSEKVTDATFTFVALDEDGKPRPVHSSLN